MAVRLMEPSAARVAAWVWMLAAVSVSLHASAATAPRALYSSPLSGSAAGCGNGEGAATTELACELARGLGPLGSRVLVAVAMPTADTRVDRGAELSSRLGAAVARAIGPQAHLVPIKGTLDRSLPGEDSASVQVIITVAITGARVRAVAQAHRARSSFWDRVRGLRGEPGGHASATRGLDGEIAAFLPPVPLVVGHVDKIMGAAPDIVALACGDVDGDGTLEIAVVGRRKIQLGRVRGARFEPHAEVPWQTLAAIASAPLREPIAHAMIATGQSLTVGSTDREGAVVLSGTLARLNRLEGILPWGPAGCLVRTGTLLGLPGPCQRGAQAPALDPGDLRTDAIASALVVNGAGAARAVIAWRVPEGGTVTLRDDAGHTAQVVGAGAALALSDLDRDGVPELVSSGNIALPAEDAVVVRSWATNGTIRDRFRVPVPDGIRALTVCPTADAGMESIVVATGSAGLWIIR